MSKLNFKQLKTKNMSQESTKSTSIKMLNVIFALLTANIGYVKHGSYFWSIVDFFLFPIAWLKWIIFQEINLSLIEKSFDWFLK